MTGASKLKQFQYEIETWKRLLDFMITENIHLKNRLSELLKDKFDDKLLKEVEDFLTFFLKEDQLIEFLRNEAAELEEIFLKEIAATGKVKKEIYARLTKLRNNMIHTERQFGELKLEFNSYLSKNI